MSEFLSHLQWWHWWVAAAVMAIAETMVPGAMVIWFAVSAAIVGALVLVLPMPWQLQLLLWGALGIVALLLWRRAARNRPDDSEQPLLNQRSAQYIGRQTTLSEAIVNGRGKVWLGDGAWTVRGPELPRGAAVRVVGADGAVLVVEAA